MPDMTGSTSALLDLEYFDHETCRLEPLDNPFGPKVLPMSPV
jgi:putative transposase